MTIYYTLLLLLHFLLAAYWLGGDFGVFYCGYYATRRDLSAETRTIIARMLFKLELIPRYCLVLTLPVGATMVLSGGYSMVPDHVMAPIIVLIWGLGFAAILLLGLNTTRKEALFLARIDFFVRLVAIALLVMFAATSFTGHGPIDRQAGWLQTKLVIYAAIIGAGLAMRHILKPLGPAFAALSGGNFSAEADSIIAKTVAKARPIALTVWAALFIEAYLGLSKLY